MKYVRFQGQMPNLGASCNLGIFQLAYQLKHSPGISRYDDKELRRNLAWLEMHLDAPKVLDESKNHRAICWFKDSARRPLERVWALKQLLEAYGFWIDWIKTSKPGLIIYQDGWQIVAKPFRSGAKG